MSIDEKFYSLNSKDVDKEDFFKNLPILFQQGFLVFVNPSSYIKQLLKPYCIDNIPYFEELKKYQIETSDTLVVAQFNRNIEKLFSNIKPFSFEYFFFLLENNECAVSWTEAGEYTTIFISLDFVDDCRMRMFCESLCINNYCTQLFSYKSITSSP